VAAVDVWLEMTGAKTQEGKEIPLRKGLLNFVMMKEGGCTSSTDCFPARAREGKP
jgi:hypothetical protein